jgi:protein-arginine kinase activator protein McsA
MVCKTVALLLILCYISNMKKDGPQLYLKCERCETYFEHPGGKRRRWCSDKCKMAGWRIKPHLTREQVRQIRQRQRNLSADIRKKLEKDGFVTIGTIKYYGPDVINKVTTQPVVPVQR